MMKTKIYKFLSLVILLFLIGISIFYWQLSNRHKAIVKTKLLHGLSIIDNEWLVKNKPQIYHMLSPDFYIDGIYKSMEGPKSSSIIQLSNDSTVHWLTGFKVKAIDSKTNKTISNDFICHTNIDINDVKYYSNFNLNERIGIQYPRLISLSHGLESYNFPKGYGVPIKGNDLLFVTTEALNHNNPNERSLIKHDISIEHSKDNTLKPLMSKTVFIKLLYDKNDPFKSPTDPGKNSCVPLETKNHSYDDEKGNKLSGHWVIPLGKRTYQSSITKQLNIKDSLRMHAAVTHVHPFATSLTLFDKTNKTILFRSNIINHKNNIGLTKIESYSSEKGIWLYGTHEYELILEVNNTSKINQDMMGSMFVFFFDKELDQILNVPITSKK